MAKHLSLHLYINVNEKINLVKYYLNTHYYNSNLIWRTVSLRVDDVIPSDHPRQKASKVIEW